MNRLSTILAVLLCAAVSLGQDVTLKQEDVVLVKGAENIDVYGNNFLVSGDLEEIELIRLPRITAITEASKVVFRCMDVDNNYAPITDFDRINNNQILLKDPTRKTLVTVVVNDAEKNIFDFVQIMYQMPNPPPDPEPEPEPEPDPDVPEPDPVPNIKPDKFDNLGQRIGALVSSMPQNDYMCESYDMAAKMARGEVEGLITNSTITNYLKDRYAGLADINQYRSSINLVNDEINKRWGTNGLTMSETAEIFDAASKGFK